MLLIDLSNLLHRNMHVLDELTDSRGNSTGGAFGCINSIHKMLKQKKYREPCICFSDLGIPLFRRELHSEYKPHKKPIDTGGLGDLSKLYSDINKNPVELDLEKESFLRKYKFNKDLLVQKLLPALGIPVIQVPNTEADDIIALWTKTVRDEYNTVVTSDKDMLQLVDDNTEWVDPIRDVTHDKASFIQTFDLVPERYQFQYKMLKSIQGDSSDNIWSIEGIGGTTAARLARQFAEGVPFEEIERPKRCSSKGFENFKKSKDHIFNNLKLVDANYIFDNNLPVLEEMKQGLRSQAMVAPDEYLANAHLKDYSMISALEKVPYIVQTQYNLDYFDIIKRYFSNN